jgi:hypothetical protein
MRAMSLTVGLWFISCGVLLSGACSSDDASDPSNAQAGSGGTSENGGDGGGSASGSHAGQGGQRQVGCVERATCGNWGPNFIDCPTSIDDLRAVCEFAPLESYESSCGGTYLEASNGVQTQRWTFDANGKLIGAYSSGDVGDCDYWGERCEPVGSAEIVCGAGGQNSGGSGGESAAGAGGVGGQGGGGGQGGIN